MINSYSKIFYSSTNSASDNYITVSTSDVSAEINKSMFESKTILNNSIELSTDKNDDKTQQEYKDSSAFLTMIASEKVLGRDWDTPEEDEAWEDLQKVKW